MSIIVSNAAQICNSPTNKSKSKMLYSFSKQSRFHQTSHVLCDHFYDIKPLTTRTTTFGFGKKFDMTMSSRCSPPSNTYNMRSQFQYSQKKGFGFGKGRQQMKITGPLVACLKNKNPGPGEYPLPSMLNTNSFSLSGKLQQINKEKQKIPGPGKYPIAISINRQGKYPISTIKNILVRNFSTTIGRRRSVQDKMPGPGRYDVKTINLSPDGRYPLSRMQNCKVRRFGKSKRNQLAENKSTPGPGNYKLPSQFGQYISKKAFQKSKSNKQN